MRKVFICIFFALVLAGCGSANTGTSITSTIGATSTPAHSGTLVEPYWGHRTKTTGCIGNALPDRACTPGDIFPHATKAMVCTSGYASTVRNVPQSEIAAVYAAYGIKSYTHGQYEVDHLVPLELGGSNTLANLWPESASPVPGFHQKDGLENTLHSQVCSGKLSLQAAQVEIATNWLTICQCDPNRKIQRTRSHIPLNKSRGLHLAFPRPLIFSTALSARMR